jgi:hypothetical protein
MLNNVGKYPEVFDAKNDKIAEISAHNPLANSRLTKIQGGIPSQLWNNTSYQVHIFHTEILLTSNYYGALNFFTE